MGSPEMDINGNSKAGSPSCRRGEMAQFSHKVKARNTCGAEQCCFLTGRATVTYKNVNGFRLLTWLGVSKTECLMLLALPLRRLRPLSSVPAPVRYEEEVSPSTSHHLLHGLFAVSRARPSRCPECTQACPLHLTYGMALGRMQVWGVGSGK